MAPLARRIALVAHVTTSVGWLGAVLVFLGLSVVGLTSDDEATVRGAYLVMRPTGSYVLMPLAVASLVSGVVQGLGTPWGVLRHYWVVFKLLISIVATLVLVTYLSTFSSMARLAADPAVGLDMVRSPSPLIHSGLALVALLAATLLSVLKPRGLTLRGQRAQRSGRAVAAPR